MALLTPEASPDPLIAATGSVLTQKPNHASPIHVSTSTNTPLTHHQSCDAEPASNLLLVVEAIKHYFRGGFSDDDLWLQFHLSSGDLSALEKLIRENPRWEDKLRYDYFERISIFVIRMSASIQHESAQEGFCEVLKRDLTRLCSGDPVRENFAAEVRNECHTNIKKGKAGKHSPDAQFRHLRAQHPGVVLEVAYSQKSKALPTLAHIYITEGAKLVVALDQEYPRSKRIVLKTWRAQIEHSSGTAPLRVLIEHQSQEFRGPDGQPIPDFRLQIPIVALAPKT